MTAARSGVQLGTKGWGEMKEKKGKEKILSKSEAKLPKAIF